MLSRGPFTYRHEYSYTWWGDVDQLAGEEPEEQHGFMVGYAELSWDGEGSFEAWARENEIDIHVDLATEDELLEMLGVDEALLGLGKIPSWISAAVTLVRLLRREGFRPDRGNTFSRSEEANYYQTEHDTEETIVIQTRDPLPTIRGSLIQVGWPPEAEGIIDSLLRGHQKEALRILADAMEISPKEILDLR